MSGRIRLVLSGRIRHTRVTSSAFARLLTDRGRTSSRGAAKTATPFSADRGRMPILLAQRRLAMRGGAGQPSILDHATWSLGGFWLPPAGSEPSGHAPWRHGRPAHCLQCDRPVARSSGRQACVARRRAPGARSPLSLRRTTDLDQAGVLVDGLDAQPRQDPGRQRLRRLVNRHLCLHPPWHAPHTLRHVGSYVVRQGLTWRNRGPVGRWGSIRLPRELPVTSQVFVMSSSPHAFENSSGKMLQVGPAQPSSVRS